MGMIILSVCVCDWRRLLSRRGYDLMRCDAQDRRQATMMVAVEGMAGQSILRCAKTLAASGGVRLARSLRLRNRPTELFFDF